MPSAPAAVRYHRLRRPSCGVRLPRSGAIGAITRRAIDWLVGGPSFRRRRRHAAGLRVGDVIDAWRVIAVEPETRLTLLMEMKAPGAGVLEFDLKAEPPAGHRITATAYFHPAGFWGLLYWYLLAPAHWLIFRGLTRAISTRATAAERRSEAH